MSLNKVILMGRLTADPELRTTASGISVASFSIAVDKPYQKDKEKSTDFISITAWRNTADFVSKYFSKGKMIIVEGSLHNNNYTDQNGVKHYSMTVQADNVQFGESKGNQQQGNQSNEYYNGIQNEQQSPEVLFNDASNAGIPQGFEDITSAGELGVPW